MSRDPFDQMRNRNPVPPEDQPPAPMSVAARIIGGRERAASRALPGFAVAAMTALAVVVTGGALLMFTRPPAENGVGAGGSTTIGTVSPTTSEAVHVTMGPIHDRDEVVYFLADQEGDGWSGGPYLFPVSVPVAGPLGADPAHYPYDRAIAALQRLLQGVGDASGGSHTLSSAIPSDTSFRGARWEDGSAVIGVELSEEFLSGGGSFSMQARLAQVVYTLTAIDGIDGVQFLIEDGTGLRSLTTVFGGEGVMVSDPAVRADFDALLPAILVESPAHLGAAGNPLVASGTANVYEATVSVELAGADGEILWEGFTTATCGTGCRGDWTVEIPYEIDAEQWGTLTVWEASAEDGRRTNVRRHTVRLGPEGTRADQPLPERCADWPVNAPFDQAGLPAEVAQTRRDVWAAAYMAAAYCDWSHMDGLLGDPFSYSFGADDDPIGFWRELEEASEEPMRYLAELLTLPYATIDGPDGLYYVWPAAFAHDDWASVPAADRDALRSLYDDDDFAGFAEFGSYIGYRVGISADGTWRFFIAGD
jgi:hypothetical protein